MVVVKSTRAICAVLGLRKTESDSYFRNVLNMILNCIYTFFLLAVNIPSLVFLVQNIKDMTNATHASYCVAATALVLSHYWYFIYRIKDANALFDRLQYLVDKKKTFDTYSEYIKLEQSHTTYARIFVCTIITADLICLLMPVNLAFFKSILGTYSHDVWFMPIPILTPYDSTTGWGYAITLALETASITTLCTILAAENIFFSGFCNYSIRMMKDLQVYFQRIDTEICCNRENMDGNKIRRNLIDCVESHVEVFEFLDELSTFIQGIIFFLFFIGVMWLCTALYQLQATTLTLDLLLIQSIINVVCISACMYSYCQNGNNVSDEASNIRNIAYSSLWYHYPLGLQPYMILILRRSQQNFSFNGYNLTNCNLESFKTLINMSGSIFMLFRTVAN